MRPWVVAECASCSATVQGPGQQKPRGEGNVFRDLTASSERGRTKHLLTHGDVPGVTKVQHRTPETMQVRNNGHGVRTACLPDTDHFAPSERSEHKKPAPCDEQDAGSHQLGPQNGEPLKMRCALHSGIKLRAATLAHGPWVGVILRRTVGNGKLAGAPAPPACRRCSPERPPVRPSRTAQSTDALELRLSVARIAVVYAASPSIISRHRR